MSKLVVYQGNFARLLKLKTLMWQVLQVHLTRQSWIGELLEVFQLLFQDNPSLFTTQGLSTLLQDF